MEWLTYRPDYPITEFNLGNKIIQSHQFKISLAHCGMFYGIKHLPIIERVTFMVSNYQQIGKIDGVLENGVWRLSPNLIPLFKLLEYSDQINLEINLEINKQKRNRFYSFCALYCDNLTQEQRSDIKKMMYLSIPTYKPGVQIEFIGNIWKVTSDNKDSRNLNRS